LTLSLHSLLLWQSLRSICVLLIRPRVLICTGVPFRDFLIGPSGRHRSVPLISFDPIGRHRPFGRNQLPARAVDNGHLVNPPVNTLPFTALMLSRPWRFPWVLLNRPCILLICAGGFALPGQSHRPFWPASISPPDRLRPLGRITMINIGSFSRYPTDPSGRGQPTFRLTITMINIGSYSRYPTDPSGRGQPTFRLTITIGPCGRHRPVLLVGFDQSS
jgi:hypothetical protein